MYVTAYYYYQYFSHLRLQELKYKIWKRHIYYLCYKTFLETIIIKNRNKIHTLSKPKFKL